VKIRCDLLLAFLVCSHCFCDKPLRIYCKQSYDAIRFNARPALCKAIIDTVSRYFSDIFTVVDASPVSDSLLLAAHRNATAKTAPES